MSIPIKEIARKCKLAPSTVRNILSSPGGRYSPQTRQQVLNVANAHGYVPSRLPLALRRRSAAAVGLLVRRLSDSYDMELLDWHIAHLSKIGLDTLVEIGEWSSPEEAKNRFNTFMSWGFQAVLVSSFGEIGSEDFRPYAKSTLIVTHQPDIWPDFSSVFMQRNLREQLAIRHLKELGHRRLGVLGFDLRIEDTQRKVAALKGAIESNGLALNPADILPVGFGWPNRFSEAGSVAGKIFDLAREFAARPRTERPSAIVALYDGLAYWLVSGLMAAGCRVPEDVSVITYNETVLAETSIVPLTTIGIAPRTVSEQMVKLVQEGLEFAREPHRFVKHVGLDPRLTVRASTGKVK